MQNVFIGKFPLQRKRELSGLIGAQREKIYIFSSDRERKMAKNRGICAAHTCIPQYREYPPPGLDDKIISVQSAFLDCNESYVQVRLKLCWFGLIPHEG